MPHILALFLVVFFTSPACLQAMAPRVTFTPSPTITATVTATEVYVPTATQDEWYTKYLQARQTAQAEEAAGNTETAIQAYWFAAQYAAETGLYGNMAWQYNNIAYLLLRTAKVATNYDAVIAQISAQPNTVQSRQILSTFRVVCQKHKDLIFAAEEAIEYAYRADLRAQAAGQIDAARTRTITRNHTAIDWLRNFGMLVAE